MDPKNITVYEGCIHMTSYKPFYKIQCGKPLEEGNSLCKYHLEISSKVKPTTLSKL